MSNKCEMEVDDIVRSLKRNSVKCRLKGMTEINGTPMKVLTVLTADCMDPFEHMKIDDENLLIDVVFKASAQTQLSD